MQQQPVNDHEQFSFILGYDTAGPFKGLKEEGARANF